MIDATLPAALRDEIASAYRELAALEAEGPEELAVAVRSSATAEDLPDASFAGQQDTFLNVEGEEVLLRTVKRVFASLYTNRAISYRVHHGFAHAAVALSAGVQKMVRSDVGASGVIFTLDTESGFRDVCMVTAAWGLGETVVQGSVNPDEWLVFKPVLAAGGSRMPIVRRGLGSKAVKRVYRTRDVSAASADATVDKPVEPSARDVFCLSDAEVLQLARFAATIEQHYSQQAGEWRPMDIEFAKDGITGGLYIVQARPETVHSSRKRRGTVLETFSIAARERQAARVLVTGRAVGAMIGAGRVRVIVDPSRMSELQSGEVLVTDMTDPDWEPVLKRAAAIVTNRGGRTCHAAIVAREIGIPAVVGSTDATSALHDGMDVTVSCAEGEEGVVLEGQLQFTKTVTDASKLKQPQRTKVSLILGNPDEAFTLSTMPVHGVGLARLEFIVSRIGVHPRACLDFDAMPEGELKACIRHACRGAASPVEHYVRSIAEGVATIAAAFFPQPVIVRMSDFKTNEYRQLLGGDAYEAQEENPMLGFRGASRYYAPSFEAAFGLECEAMKRARDVLGLSNIELMLPFVRTETELLRVLAVMERHGLHRGDGAGATAKDVAEAAHNHGNGGNGLCIHVMCEVPSNALLADQFLRHVDGFSIGSNDLTQLTLGVDRDSGVLNGFDERDEAVKLLMGAAIDAANNAGKYIGICGQAPSDFPELAAWLVRRGIRSVSLNPDSVVRTLQAIVEAEEQVGQ